MKRNLFVLTSLLTCSIYLSNIQAYCTQNEKDYKSLLSKSYFYKDTKVRHLKYLAAKLIVALCKDMKQDNETFNTSTTYTLSRKALAGLKNLKGFAKKIMESTGTEPKIVSSAFDYIDAVVLFGAHLSVPHYVYKAYFPMFNKYYTPLIQAIWFDYKRNTALPFSIDWDIIKMWGTNSQFESIIEPGI